MANFSFKALVESYRKGVISDRYLYDKLHDYLVDVYTDALQHTHEKGTFNSSRSRRFDDYMIHSITERIIMSIKQNPDDFYKATDVYKEINELKDTSIESYEIFHCSEQKVVLDAVKAAGTNKNIKISFGINSGTVFVEITDKKSARAGDELSVASYALADNNDVLCIDKVQKDCFTPSYNTIENAIICNRFDPFHMQTNGTKGYDPIKHNHPNKFKEAGVVDPVELSLYEKYFREKARCPHFHYYTKTVCDKLNKNSASFAINMQDLARYLTDLDDAFSNPALKNDPILQYDLGMPYLDMIQGKIVCEMDDFIKTAKTIFQKYYGAEKCRGISLLYSLIDCTRRGDISGGLACAADIMCFVNSTPPLEAEKHQYVIGLVPAENLEKNAVLTTALAQSFMAIGGENIDVKKLAKYSEKNDKKNCENNGLKHIEEEEDNYEPIN